MLRMKTPETQALVSGCSLSSRRLYQHTLTRHITSNNREPQTKEDPEKGSKVELDLNGHTRCFLRGGQTAPGTPAAGESMHGGQLTGEPGCPRTERCHYSCKEGRWAETCRACSERLRFKQKATGRNSRCLSKGVYKRGQKTEER